MTIDSDEETAGRRRLRWRIGAVSLGAAVLLIVWWPGCREYPAVTSKESLGLMRLLYAACNTKDPARLAKVEKDLEKLTRDNKLTPPEHEAFAGIVDMAKAGDWTRAEKAALKFAQDQVGQGSLKTQGNDPRR